MTPVIVAARSQMPVNEQAQPVRQETNDKGKAFIKLLTGLHFVAALIVVMHHFLHINVSGESHGIGHLLKKLVNNFASAGFVGVSFFFVLSGFILTYTYLGRPGQVAINRRDFWIARVARVYPTYLFALAVAAVPFWRGWGGVNTVCATPRIVTALTTPVLLQAWTPCAWAWWNAPGWSLSAEAFFYLLFPLIAVPIVRLGRRQLCAVMAFTYLIHLFVLYLYMIITVDGQQPFADHGTWWDISTYLLRTLPFDPLVRLAEFVIGVALGSLFLKGGAHRRERRARWFTSPGALSIAASIAIVAVLAVFGPLHPWAMTPTNVLLVPFFTLLIYGVAFNEEPIATFFSLPLLVLASTRWLK